MKDKIKKWLNEEESGQGLVEYALIIVVVAIAIIWPLTYMKAAVANALQELRILVWGA